MDNPLKILGLKPGDTLKTAHKNRNALFLKLHPDKNPTDKEKYQKVYDAYDILEKNPNLLNVIRVSSNKIDHNIRVKAVVSVEDFYFKKPQSITINRKVFCKLCGGIGSASGISNKCSYCNGTGKIESSIFTLLGKGSSCLMCKGKGITTEDQCPSCGGLKYEQETKTIQFTLEPFNFHRKLVILHNVGNQIEYNTYGSVSIILRILNDSNIGIEENYFVMHDKILPVQKIIGDTKTTKIFGRDIKYQIKENSTEAYAKDHISPTNSPDIRIKFVDIAPMFTRETISLYKKILEIEKNNLTNGSSIQL
jgi:DnaJ-class molecular chaperone